jgi:hypothetical protein
MRASCSEFLNNGLIYERLRALMMAGLPISEAIFLSS